MESTTAKLILVGTSSVGKTSIVNKIVSGEFNPISTPTLSSQYSHYSFDYDGTKFSFQIWDTAGDEKFRSIVPMFYRDSKAAFIVFALDSLESFKEVDYYYSTLTNFEKIEDIAVFIVGNKLDLVNNRMVSYEQGEEYAKTKNATYFEVSAKNGNGIVELFNSAAKEVLEKGKVTIISALEESKDKKCSC